MILVSFALHAILAGVWAALVGYTVLSVLGVKPGRATRRGQHPSPPVPPVVTFH
jgi:hypothetical protein